MSTDPVSVLEQRIDQLIEASQRLCKENAVLREREGRLLRERGSLLEKNEQARVRIENMISRLKALSLEK